MPTEQNLTWSQASDETVAITVTAQDPGEDLTGVDALVVYVKPDACTDDDDPEVLVLNSATPSEVTILTQTADEITAEAYIPAAYLAEPYDRVWRVDAIGSSGERRPAMYGSVTVLDT